MPLIFPNTPIVGQSYNSGSSAIYQWNGTYWEVVAPKLLTSASYAISSSRTEFAATASYILAQSNPDILWADQKHSGQQWGVNFAYLNRIFAVGSNYSYRPTGYANSSDYSGLLNEILILKRPNAFTKLSVTSNNIFALGDNGVAYTYGVNSYGQLGNGNVTNVFGTPMQPITASTMSGSGIQVLDVYGPNNWTFTHNNMDIACPIFKVNDNVTLKYYGLGRNTYGNLGIGNFTDQRSVPSENIVMRGKNIVSMSMGGADGSSVMALVDDGTVWTWGFNNYGQLGVGNSTNQATPQQAKSGSGLVAITGAKDVQSTYMTDESSFSYYNTFILKADGTVLGCGLGAGYLRGNGDNVNNFTYFTDVKTSATTKLQNIVKLYCKGWQRAALDSSGNLWAWGTNWYSHWGNGAAENTTLQYATIIATGVEDVNIDAATARLGKLLVKQGGVWYASGYNAGYSLMRGYRDGSNIGTRTEMALPYGKTVKQWIPVGNYVSTDLSAIMLQTTDNDIYIGGYCEYVIGSGTGNTAAATKVNWNIN